MAGDALLRLRRRALRALAALAVLGTVGLLVSALGTFGAVHYTARSEFCDSCHIMEPYYASWESSSHAHVACIECHYEPGAVETLEGKFKALSQLAKYVTRTAGTKPWAEVSDYSCMRSGCHSVRMLDGEIEFGRVAFDHRHHLLESRRGRRLRCVTCHSQIVQGEHVSVTPSVCFMCHFMPDAEGAIPERTGDCLICHGPPSEPVEVAGREFVHAEFVERGVDCRECHDPVVEGSGRVGRERCHSCHGEVGHIERIGETEFLHETHVTEHKVECFECHDDIHHGLLPLEPMRPAAAEGCGTCHASSHDSASQLYAGTGAAGVPDEPSRMYSTRVVCGACHTGRAGGRAPGADEPAPHGHGGTVAAAGDVDCIHCHGPEFGGMLARWQGAVGGELERLRPLLSELEAEIGGLPEHSARAPLAEARQNVDLVALDGSRGAHNPTYALAALRAGAERIDRARELLGAPSESSAAAGMPSLSRDGCSSCHLGVESAISVAPGRGPFPHGPHLARAGLECAACHAGARFGAPGHGAPAPDRADCASCHHAEGGAFDPWDCARCHSAAEQVLFGSIEGFEGEPGAKAEMECTDCHGEPPEVVRPGEALCVLCHDDESRAGFDAFRSSFEARLAELGRALELAPASGAGAAEVERARRAHAALRADATLGAHNSTFALQVLAESLEALRPAADSGAGEGD